MQSHMIDLKLRGNPGGRAAIGFKSVQVSNRQTRLGMAPGADAPMERDDQSEQSKKALSHSEASENMF